jgi:hypothetical protein
MRKLGSRMLEVRVEVVTTTFVASGRPTGVQDLGRFIENLNNPAAPHQIELRDPAVRPLYRATNQLHLNAPLLVRREEIVFANFEGPYLNHGSVRPTQVDVPVLLLAPPFQIQGHVALAPGADATQTLRMAAQGFFVVTRARVYDAEGSALGEGDQIIINGMAVQMTAATKQHIVAAEIPVHAADEDEPILEQTDRAA